MKTNPESPKIFICENCNFGCSNKKDYTRHLSTAKHLNTMNPQQKTPVLFGCECGKSYGYRASLFNHKKKCNVNLINAVISPETEDNRDELIERLVSSNTEMITSSNEMKSMFQILLEKYHESQIQNQELMNKVIDVIPQIGNTTNSNNNNNNSDNSDNIIERGLMTMRASQRMYAQNIRLKIYSVSSFLLFAIYFWNYISFVTDYHNLEIEYELCSDNNTNLQNQLDDETSNKVGTSIEIFDGSKTLNCYYPNRYFGCSSV